MNPRDFGLSFVRLTATGVALAHAGVIHRITIDPGTTAGKVAFYDAAAAPVITDPCIMEPAIGAKTNLRQPVVLPLDVEVSTGLYVEYVADAFNGTVTVAYS